MEVESEDSGGNVTFGPMKVLFAIGDLRVLVSWAYARVSARVPATSIASLVQPHLPPEITAQRKGVGLAVRSLMRLGVGRALPCRSVLHPSNDKQ